ncbi:prolyl oligopeptidase family protein [Asticcacaulis biprosthecium C19]|uniref:Prolyl oligopeptidase family protein n=1 Tax=Asticcacaulis biprosthecium C19 TaxID=715226 RepID=F4QI83_9CAUL|nr:prolyl oligopeptidase family serine peptidase [Asticcacaulis biprosthecium]EGF91721.1 prolyl oligopeptidase family protein [Asticcacaulis biprosthecium C19]
MRYRSIALALILAASTATWPAIVQAAPATTIAARYAASDQYAPGKIDPLIIDLDMQARFVKDGVLYRKGAKGKGVILLADPVTGVSHELAQDAVLVPKLTASGATFGETVDIRPTGFADGVLTVAAGGKEWSIDAAGAVTAKARAEKPDGVVSPDGKFRIVSRNYNLWKVEVATGKETPLTADGSYDARYGINYPLLGDMVAANSETPDMEVGAQWSEDGKQILTFRLSRNGSYIWHGVQPNPPGSQFPREFTYVYPTAGAVNVPHSQPVLIDAATGKVTDLNVPAVPLLWPGNPALWWEKGQVIYEWQARGYGELKLYAIDPATNVATVRVRESLKPIVTVTSTAMVSAPQLKGTLVISERSGWAQLYYVADGSDPNGGQRLTQGEWEVTNVAHIADGGPVLVGGIGREPGVNPYFRSLYKVGLDGAIANLTPEPLDHDVTLSEDAAWFIDRMSSPTEPTRTLLRSGADGRIVAELGRADPSALLATGFTMPEAFETVADDGKTKLYGMIYRPKNFDPKKKYPVIENVYTGPTTHRFEESYGDNVRGSVNSVAQLGAIVVTIDGRGTSQRGQAFRSSAYQNLGEVGLDDHIWVLKAMKKKYPYFDLDRVGVYGGSAGGYDTARFVLRRPDFYKVGVASSGNHDLRLDKAWWPEVSMGIADDATWERNSNASVAGNLKGKLMLIHGDIDDNVPVAASYRLSQALVAAGKPHELVILPNTNHAVFQPYYWNKLRDYFAVNLLGETPPVEKK